MFLESQLMKKTINMFFSILNLILLVCSTGYLSEGSFFPLEPSTPWKQGDIQDLVCIGPYDTNKIKHLYKDKAKSYWTHAFPYTGTENKKKHETICRALRLTTNCVTSFWGTKTISRLSEERSPNLQTCSKMLKDSSSIESMEHPAASYKWWSSSSRSGVGYDITDHLVIFDRYQDAFLDRLFLGGICHHQPCQTIHSNMVRLTEEGEPGCPEAKQTNEKYVSINGTVYLFTHPYRPVRLGGCAISYSGVEGTMSEHGDFVEVDVSKLRIKRVSL